MRTSPTPPGAVRRRILHFLDSLPSRILAKRELDRVIAQQKAGWNLGNAPTAEIIEGLTNWGKLQIVQLPFSFRPVTRFCWGPFTAFELVQSFNRAGYFSHYSAMQVHGLTEQSPKTIYFNVEQKLRGGGGTYTQTSIDRAFKGKCRVSTNVATHGDFRICLLNGGNTDQLGVVETEAPDASTAIRVTNVERTLIDIVVRPIYSGGIYEVAKAFELAKSRVSVNRVAAYLRTLNYTYPYHQSIGCLMERAGYRANQLDLLRQLPIEVDFYLDYGMKETDYDSSWRLFVPKGF